MSENLTRLAQKIDFSKPIIDEVKSEPNDGEKIEESIQETPLNNASVNLPFEAIAAKIRYFFQIHCKI